MINKERCSFIFLLILAILDQMNASLFSVDFTYSSLSFVSHLCFCGCILVVSHEKKLKSTFICMPMRPLCRIVLYFGLVF